MKSKAPRKTLSSNFSSQDELTMKRSLKSDNYDKRNRKPSIYDELDDDEFMERYDEDDFDGYDNDEEEEEYAEGDED